jgi:putative zinc finger protein
VSGRPCHERLLLPEALSGRLDPADEKRVMAHLQTCVACQDAAADIEISLISLAVLRDEQAVPLHAPLAAPAAGAGPGPGSGSTAVAEVRWLRHLPTVLVAAAAALLIAGAGVLVGHSVLPPRDRTHYGVALALRPPPGAKDPAIRGTVAVASEGSALAVRLNATALPTTGWYECVWVANGQTRSAGSFRATTGVAKNVELRVAQPQDAAAWDLEVVHHVGDASEVVLEGSATYG